MLPSLDTISYKLFNVYEYTSKRTRVSESKCVNYIIFCQDPEITATKFGNAIDSRVFIVTIGSKWQIQEFFKSPASQNIMNLLIASAGPALQEKNKNIKSRSYHVLTGVKANRQNSIGNTKEILPVSVMRHLYDTTEPDIEVADIKLYTHEMYIDGLGSSAQTILTTWKLNKFTRPEVDLYPVKLVNGFRGHRFILSAIENPPLSVDKVLTQEQSTSWDGVEIRLLQIISRVLNFTLGIHDATFSKSR
ncbi:ionotropic receptor 21a-like [Acyrthosiphon pisum]|uniref:Uncharacterized protein n=1 Tax=Acyrthosiphon pisum TaxID=7029 RepID=A0A8R2NTC2_ACYPI|nr:ionotropic receptor 21a-like [Acyrthosiphon pisum]